MKSNLHYSLKAKLDRLCHLRENDAKPYFILLVNTVYNCLGAKNKERSKNILLLDHLL